MSRGFTLLEALIALAILAIGLTASMRSLMLASDSAADLQRRQLATWVAENRLAEMRALAEFPEVGSSNGRDTLGGEEFLWRRDVSQTPNALFRRVDIHVTAAGGGNDLSRLVGFAVRPLK